MFLVVVLLLYPTLASDFALNARSDRTISADAVVFAAEAEAQEAFGKHLRTPKSIPSSSWLPLSPYLYLLTIWYD